MRDIPGYEGRYAVTEDGRVWSHAKRHGANNSQGHDGRWLSPAKHVKGYLWVSLFSADGKRKRVFVHRIVALVYCLKAAGCEQVNHLDGAKDHNAYSNLEWCTAKQNIRHAIETGLTDTRAPNKLAAMKRNAALARAAKAAQP